MQLNVFFNGLGANTKSILSSDDYVLNKQKWKINSQTDSGLKWAAEGSVGKGKSAGALTLSIPKNDGISLDMFQLTTEGQMLTNSSFYAKPNLKFLMSVEDSYAAARSKTSSPSGVVSKTPAYGRIGMEYIRTNKAFLPAGAFSLDVDCVNGPTIKASAMIPASTKLSPSSPSGVFYGGEVVIDSGCDRSFGRVSPNIKEINLGATIRGSGGVPLTQRGTLHPAGAVGGWEGHVEVSHLADAIIPGGGVIGSRHVPSSSSSNFTLKSSTFSLGFTQLVAPGLAVSAMMRQRLPTESSMLGSASHKLTAGILYEPQGVAGQGEEGMTAKAKISTNGLLSMHVKQRLNSVATVSVCGELDVQEWSGGNDVRGLGFSLSLFE